MNILEKAKELKEIRSDINVELFASIFENVFLGSYLSGIVYTDGYKIEQLEREVMQIYQLIKAQLQKAPLFPELLLHKQKLLHLETS